MTLIRIISWLNRQKQNQQMVETNIVPAIGFNIFTNAKYSQVKFVGDEATLWASNASLRKSIKKS